MPVLLSILAAVALAGCHGVENQPNPNRLVLGYETGDSASVTSAESTSNPVNVVALDLMTVNADGSLNGAIAFDVTNSDRSQGKLSYLTISNFGSTDFDPAIAHGAMVTNRGTTIKNIVAVAGTLGLTGINIDFEGIYPGDRTAYTEFVADLAGQLHAHDSLLMLSVPAKSADDPSDDFTWPFDYAAIGESADFIQVMTYDEHYPGGPPGAVAGLDWMEACLNYAITQIGSGKILLGLPAYGYDWNLTTGTAATVEWKDFAATLSSIAAKPQFDTVTDSAHVSYTASDGSQHEFWYDTPRSIQDKTHLAITDNLGGVSMWALGFENASFWNAVTAGLKQD